MSLRKRCSKTEEPTLRDGSPNPLPCSYVALRCRQRIIATRRALRNRRG